MQLVDRLSIQIPNPSVILAILLIFIVSAFVIISGIYVNTLFLTSYPRTWLIYFLVALAFFTAFFGIILTPLFTNNIKRNSLLLLGIFIIMMIAFVVVRHIQFYWMPFIIAIAMGVMNVLIAVIAWGVIPLAFNIREYKNVARLAGYAFTAGAIIGSFIIPLQLKYLPLDSLLYLLAFLSLVIGLNIYLLPLIAESRSTVITKQDKTPLHYPLFNALLIFIICITASQSLIDYIFKFEAAKHYSGQALGSFFGWFSGITSIVGLILGMTSIKYIIKYFSLEGILYATPIFTFIVSLSVIAMPGLWSLCVLASIRPLFYHNYTTLSTEIVLNILPSFVREKAKFQIKTIFIPFISFIVLFMLMIFTNKVGIISITVIIAVIVLICLFQIKRIINNYKTTLQTETEFRRFNVLDQTGDANTVVLQQLIHNSLNSTDSNVILLGLSSITKSNTSKLPSSIYAQLNNPNIAVRESIINLIRKFNDEQGLHPLLNQFSIETNVDNKFLILITITQLNSDVSLKIARDIIKNPTDTLYPAAIDVLIECGTSEEKEYAKDALHNLVQHKDALARREAAKIIGRLSLINYESALNELIADKDNHVSTEAIKAAVTCKMVTLTPQIIKQLAHSSRISTVYKAISRLGVPTLMYLLSAISESKNPTLLIKALNGISGLEIENAISILMKTDNAFLRYIISKEVNARACMSPPTKTFRKMAREFALEEIANFTSLTYMYQQTTAPNQLAEIQSRLYMTKKNILNWLAVATDPVKITKLIPSLLHSTHTSTFMQAQAKAMELLEIYIKDKTLLEQIINIFEAPSRAAPLVMTEYKDAWLTRIKNAELNQGDNMDLLSKVFDLRGMEIFKDLPAEVLIAIAEETERLEFHEGETVFLENDPPTGLYCISSGEVRIERQGKVLNMLKAHDYFGELALIDDSARTADAYIQSDASLLYLSKETFDRITDDLPEVLRTVTKVILKYLRQRIA
ncbi:MAG: cyclic nucleotide-binding domain-containing protein [Gammaproteobacteria bacterium]|nr:cyclic nucleotide-binding domain-containing protein [Gammaproteobacteria bacterium]